jgi:putative peptidoglycan lipid II flippase
MPSAEAPVGARRHGTTGTTSVRRAATTVAALTLLSRVLGFVRDVVMYRTLGANWVTGTFTIAWLVPNLLRTWFGEGALAAALIPAYARARARGEPGAARALLGAVLGTVLAVLGALVLLVVGAALLWPAASLGFEAVAGSPERGPDVTAAAHGRYFLDLLAILFPYVLPICLAAICGGALQAHGVFAPAAAAPIVLNAFWIAGLSVAAGSPDLPGAARVVAAFLLAGGVAQLLGVALPLARRGALPPPRLARRGDPARDVFAAMAPTVLGLSIQKLSILVNQLMAHRLIDAEAPNFVYLADRLLLFPHALTAMALATAVFPRLAELAADGRLPEVRARLNQTLESTLFLAVPASAGVILLAQPLFEIAFVSERFTTADAGTAAWTTAFLVAGLPFLGCAQLLARALYALGNARKPAVVAVALFVLNVALNLMFVAVLGADVRAFTLATSLCALLDAAILYRIVHRRVPGPHPRLRGVVRVLLATACMVPAVLAARGAFGADGRWARAVSELAVPMAAGAAAFLAANHLLGGRELAALFARARR